MLFLSGFQTNRSMGDLILICALFGVGWFMKRYQWPRVPIILGLVLAEPLEKYMWLSLNTYGAAMLARPQVWCLVGLSLLSVMLSLRAQRATRGMEILERGSGRDIDGDRSSSYGPQRQQDAKGATTSDPIPPGSFLSRRKSFAVALEALFLGGNFALFIYFIVASRQWPLSAALLPRMVSGAGLVFLTCYLIQRIRYGTQKIHEGGRILDIGFRDSDLTYEEISQRVLRVVGSMAALLAGVWLVGFHITIPLYLLVYCTVYGGMRWWNALIVAAGFEVFIVGVYDLLVHVIWNEPLLLKMASIAGPFMFR
jgi:hypothetical protein